MSDLFDSDFLEKIQKLIITSKLILTSNSAGNRKSKSKGSSVEFTDYRDYASGDDFRRIDWNAYGRFEKLFIKLFMEEREASVHVILDTSKSMDWGNPNKSYISRRLAAALIYVSLSNYDVVSVSCINSDVEKSKSKLRGKNSFGDVLRFLENVEYRGSTDLFKALESSQYIQGKGITIIISDLLPPYRLADTIKLLQFKKQEVHICHLLSPQELDPEVNTSLRLIDSETGLSRDVTMSVKLLKLYQKVLGGYKKEIEETCLNRGVNYVGLESDMAVERMLKMVSEF